MPELPEIEHLRLTLLPQLAGSQIVAVQLHRCDVLKQSADHDASVNSRLLVRSTIIDMTRRGKQLAIIAEDGRSIVVQLGMSGQLLFLPAGKRLIKPSHVHCTWRLRSPVHQGRLIFRDPRRFGGLRSFNCATQLNAHFQTLGPDALAIKAQQLSKQLSNTRRTIKAALLDQSILAGVGNIYADEVLFDACIHPLTVANSISASDITRISCSIRRILSQAVKSGGSTLRDFVDGNGQPGHFRHAHCVYGRAGQPCLRCGRLLEQMAIAQRTTVFCEACQPTTSPTSCGPDIHSSATRHSGSVYEYE